MRIAIVCVGRAKASAEQELCDAFLKRACSAGKTLGFSQIELVVVETSRGSSTQARMAEERQRLVKRIPSAGHRVVLDERAGALKSEAFAGRLASLRDSGVRDLVFVIGGPDGLAPDFREEAQEQISLGPQTWPHLLVRAMLAEQIFRGLTIMSGHPYHRGG
jgi:23S rRNA (pseudouridine1915-N3)-methyltransferase